MVGQIGSKWGGGVVTEREYLQINKSLIGGNVVTMTRVGKLRIINGYVNITEPIKNNDILVYLPVGDRPPLRQWHGAVCFAPTSSVGKTLGMFIDENGADIHINDNAATLTTGAYNINFEYFVD